MDRGQLLKRLDAAWQELKASYADLTEEQLLIPGVVGEWTLKDVLAHVTTWEEEALQYLPLIVAGGTPPRYSTQYGGIDAFNASSAARKRDLSLSQVLSQLEAMHRRLVAAAEAIPEEQIARETRARRRLRLDTYSHYREHAKAVQAWREMQLGSD